MSAIPALGALAVIWVGVRSTGRHGPDDGRRVPALVLVAGGTATLAGRG
jgi:hypothetical protein